MVTRFCAAVSFVCTICCCADAAICAAALAASSTLAVKAPSASRTCVERFTREITEGIDGSGIRAGLIKVAGLNSLGIPVVYFVAPQIWAWFSHRVRKVRANFAEVLCTLPFEEASSNAMLRTFLKYVPRDKADGFTVRNELTVTAVPR